VNTPYIKTISIKSLLELKGYTSYQ